MSRSDDHFEGEFPPHTKLKHLILKTYLEAWAHKMLLRPGAGNRVVIIDACAGRGTDGVGNHGSPLIAARQAAVAMSHLQEMSGRPIQIVTVAVEKKQSHFRELAALLAPFGENAIPLHGELIDHIDEVLRQVGTAPILCFIDPFGVEPLRAAVVRKILARPQSEVFVLFADTACLRHHGASAAREADLEPATDLFTSAGIEPPSNPPSREELSRAVMLEVTAERAEQILDAAFGEIDWRRRITEVPRAQRRATFLALYQEFLKDAGAHFVLPIPIRNNDNQHVYHLVHASQSFHGLVTMKEAVSAALRRAPLTPAVVDTIRFAIRPRLDEVEQRILEHFAGCEVPWTSTGEDGFGPLKNWVLIETPVYPHQLDELKARLKRFKLPGRAIVYRFTGERPAGTLTSQERSASNL